jgi:hypothetical protein
MVGSGEFSRLGELAEQNGCEFVMSGEEIKPRWCGESVETAKGAESRDQTVQAPPHARDWRASSVEFQWFWIDRKGTAEPFEAFSKKPVVGMRISPDGKRITACSTYPPPDARLRSAASGIVSPLSSVEHGGTGVRVKICRYIWLSLG